MRACSEANWRRWRRRAYDLRPRLRCHGGLGFALETQSTDAAPVRLQRFESNVDGHCHDRRLLRALLTGPYNDVSPLNTRDVKDDALLMLVVDDAPGIAGVG